MQDQQSTQQGILAAKQLAGDNQDQLTIALLNSKVYQDAMRIK